MRTLLVRLGVLAPHRMFALLDSSGVCTGFCEATQTPAGRGWVEIHETRLHWLGRPLPASARVGAHPAALPSARALAG